MQTNEVTAGADAPAAGTAIFAPHFAPPPFHTLRYRAYSVIVADPPWKFELWSDKNLKKSPAGQYKVTPTSEIERFPVHTLATDNAILLLWTSAPQLLDARNVAEAWGFPKYVSRTSWRKTFPSGAQAMGTGYWVRTMHEDVLIFTRGKPKIAKAFPSLFDGVRREHSRKPDSFYELVRERTPNATRCDLFSRSTHDGFDGWGNEHGKFDGDNNACGAPPRQADSLGAGASAPR